MKTLEYACRTANRINELANPTDWRIERRGFMEENPLGLADWYIVSTADDYTNEEATISAVEAAWDDDRLAIFALAFLKRHAPESYVRAIYAAHQACLPAICGQV